MFKWTSTYSSADGSEQDLTLVLNTFTCKANASLVRNSMPYVDVMLSLKQTTEQNVSTVTLPETVVSAVALDWLMQYIHVSVSQITKDNIAQIVMAADFLGMENVMNHCCAVLPATLNALNIIDIHQAVKLLSCDFTAIVDKQLSLRFMQVSKTASFLRLCFDDLCAYLQRPDLYVDSELDVLQAIVQWVDVQQDSRTKHLPVLLDHVRWCSAKAPNLARVEALVTKFSRLFCSESVRVLLCVEWEARLSKAPPAHWVQSRKHITQDALIAICKKDNRIALYIYQAGLWTHDRSFASELLSRAITPTTRSCKLVCVSSYLFLVNFGKQHIIKVNIHDPKDAIIVTPPHTIRSVTTTEKKLVLLLEHKNNFELWIGSSNDVTFALKQLAVIPEMTMNYDWHHDLVFMDNFWYIITDTAMWRGNLDSNLWEQLFSYKNRSPRNCALSQNGRIYTLSAFFVHDELVARHKVVECYDPGMSKWSCESMFYKDACLVTHQNKLFLFKKDDEAYVHKHCMWEKHETPFEFGDQCWIANLQYLQ